MRMLIAIAVLAGLAACALPAHEAKFGPASSQRAVDADEALTAPGKGLPVPK